MEKINTILDRKPLNSEYINSKQDFNKVMDGFQKLKPPVMKSGWFYGTVGLATIALIVTAVSMSSSDLTEKKNLATTNSENNTSIQQKPTNTNSNSIVLAQTETDNTIEVQPVEVAQIDPIPELAPKELPNNERIIVAIEPTVEPAKITKPHIAGIFNGPISFSNFCDPMGIQVNEDVIIVEYTIHYFSCAQEVTAKIRGSKIPSDVCKELSGCGERIEIDFLHVKGYSKKTGEPIKFDSFTLIPTI